MADHRTVLRMNKPHLQTQRMLTDTMRVKKADVTESYRVHTSLRLLEGRPPLLGEGPVTGGSPGGLLFLAVGAGGWLCW